MLRTLKKKKIHFFKREKKQHFPYQFSTVVAHNSKIRYSFVLFAYNCLKLQKKKKIYIASSRLLCDQLTGEKKLLLSSLFLCFSTLKCFACNASWQQVTLPTKQKDICFTPKCISLEPICVCRPFFKLTKVNVCTKCFLNTFLK